MAMKTVDAGVRYQRELAKYARRREAMRKLRADGKTLQEIGDRYGISRARVSQLLKM